MFETHNSIADQFAHAQISKLKEISERLSRFGITHFSYNKFIGCDKAIILCPQMPKFREQFGYSLDLSITQPQLDQILQRKNFLFWQNYGPGNPVLETLREYNVNHGLTLFRQVEKDIYESYHFATTNDNELIKEYYFNNLSFLNAFADYFADKVYDIIDHRDPGKITQIKNPLLEEKSQEDVLLREQP
ncbi:MAG: hypothetical protein FJX71_02640 [Alphaproteobacteria bacterium]|nr:hypothetical protein [Alphaproteobacteria bacterium]